MKIARLQFLIDELESSLTPKIRKEALKLARSLPMLHVSKDGTVTSRIDFRKRGAT